MNPPSVVLIRPALVARKRAAANKGVIMNEFMWGMMTGAVAAPFAWEGLKWCYRKMKGELGNE